jgi:predicted anti-sigma-YlaC factor YlaD
VQPDHRLDSENCVPARRAFSLALDREASLDKRIVAASHVQDCPRCRAFAARVAVVTAILRSCSSVTPASLPDIAGTSRQRNEQSNGSP